MLVVVLCVLAAVYLIAVVTVEARELDQTYLDVLGLLYEGDV